MANLEMSKEIRLFRCLIQEKRFLKSHTSSVARQQDLLFEKIEVFSHTNHRLRELLREWSEYEVQEMTETVS